MARTYLSGNNSRHGETTAAGGSYAHFRGWNAGVQVRHYISDDGRDEFHVYMTSGSGGSRGDVLIGTVADTPDGPSFTPVARRSPDLAAAS